MTDAEFLDLLKQGQLDEFPHRAHLRLTWLTLRADGFAQGSANVRALLRPLTAAHGAPGKYHETITLFWIYLVQHALTLTPEIDSFDAFIAAHDHLLDTGLLRRHYSPDVLGKSRSVWMAPDRIPLPGTALQPDPQE